MIKKNLFSFNVIDKPDNIRKLHHKPTPSMGGFFFLISLLYIFTLDIINISYFNTDYEFFLEGFKSKISFYFIGLGFFLLGYLDDKLDIRSNFKIFLMILLIYFSQLLDNTLIIETLYISFLEKNIYLDKDLSIFFTTFAILAFINAINMYDGKNLQIGLYVLIFLIFLIFKSNNLILTSLLVSLVFFLSQNYNGKIFIGNNGTHFLGYILAFFLIKIYNSPDIFIFADEIFILMMIPGIDMIRLFFKRTLKGKSPFIGDMDHIHHILSFKFKNLKIQIILCSIIIISLFLYMFVNFYISFIFTLISYIYLLNCQKNEPLRK